jgi:hypothetical protein
LTLRLRSLLVSPAFSQSGHLLLLLLTIAGYPAPNKFQNGTRTNGRAFNSANWRVKSDESPGGFSPRSSNQGSNNYNNRSPYNRGSQQQASPAIAEGRRLYVGNMPYTAKKEDVETLFAEGDYQMCDFHSIVPPPCREDLHRYLLAAREGVVTIDV